MAAHGRAQRSKWAQIVAKLSDNSACRACAPFGTASCIRARQRKRAVRLQAYSDKPCEHCGNTYTKPSGAHWQGPFASDC
eukprot:2159421-Pleurochrysis_carterae.AAC.2